MFNYKYLQKKTKLFAGIQIFIIVSVFIFTPVSSNLTIQKAEGAAAAAAAAAAVNTGVTAVQTTALAMKEYVLDNFANAIAKVFLRKMVASIVNWINSGFKGSPAFVSDLQGFMRDVADAAVGELIYNDPSLNFLCSPFKLDIKIALATQYSQTAYKGFTPQCTLSDVVGNVQGFLDGAFTQEGWFELTQNPVNTPQGAYLAAKNEMYARILNAQGEEITKLGFGNGFFSLEICDIADKQSGAKPNCKIGTPGSVIANSINKALGAGQDELISADEINEIFSALLSQLAQKAITGVYGLLGLGGNSSYTDYNFDGGSGTNSLIDAIEAEADSGLVSTSSLSFTSSQISLSLTTEQSNLQLQNEIIVRVDAAEVTYNQASTTLAAKSCSIGFSFPTSLSDARTAAQSNIATSQSLVLILQRLDSDFNNAQTAIEQRIAIQQYNNLQVQNILTTTTDNVQTALFIENTLTSDIANMQTNITAELNSCP